MPRSPWPCANCGKLRSHGGQSKRDGLCRLCAHKVRREAKAPPAVYSCIECRARRVSGPHRMCPPCAGVHGAKRGPRGPGITIGRPIAGQPAQAPSVSWWASGVPREQWGEAVAAQLPRLHAVNVSSVAVLKY